MARHRKPFASLAALLAALALAACGAEDVVEGEVRDEAAEQCRQEAEKINDREARDQALEACDSVK